MQPIGMEGLSRLHDLVMGIHRLEGVDETLAAVLDGVRELLGFDVALVDLMQPDGSFECQAVGGSDDVRRQLLGRRRPRGMLSAEQEGGERWGSLVFVDHRSATQAGGAVGAGDLLCAPLLSRSGELLGSLCVDLPHGKPRPGAVQCRLLEMFAAHAAMAIETSSLLEMTRSSEITMRLAFEGAGNPMALVSLDPADRGRYLRANPALCRLLGRTEAELQRLTVRDVMHPDEHERHARDLQQLINKELTHYTRERRYVRADGEPVWVELVVTVVDEVRGQTPFTLALMQDITARRRFTAELQRRATHDALTDLPNRRALHDRLRQSLDLARSAGPGAVLFCDLDGFKSVNDEFGHAAGDKVLLAVAERLSALVRGADEVYRIGGDEFVVVADGMPPERSHRLAQEVTTAVQEPIAIGEDGVTVSVTVSVGTAVIAADREDTGALLEEADRAMYAAKTARSAGVPTWAAHSP